MYRTIADFAREWEVERGGTLRVLGALTDASLAQPVEPAGRTLGRIAWHLVGTLGEMPAKAGLTIAGPAEDAPAPATAAEILAAYEAASAALGAAVGAQWTDALLVETVPMYGEAWMRGFVLACLVRHQAHHRGQMTVLMRQAGVVVPGVYGPAREEWAAFGMTAPA